MTLKIYYIFFFYFITALPISLFAQETKDKVIADKKYQIELTALLKNPKIQSALKIIKDLEPQTRKDHITLTEIPAPPFKEEKRAKKFWEMLKAAGADSIWIDKAGNVIALRKGSIGKKIIVIEGHLDTVFPEGTDVTVKEKGDTLFAPGIGDDTRGLVAVLTIFKTLQKAKINTEANIFFVGTTGEEGLGDLRGVKELFNGSLPKIDSYISIDGGGSGEIITRAVGSRRYRITYKGPGGHSYGSFGLVNPHNATARAINNFVTTADKFTKTGKKTTYNVGILGGGTSVNSIPFESWMEVDLRSESATQLIGIDKLLQAAIQKALINENKIKRSGTNLTVDIKLIGERPTGEQSISLPLIQRSFASNEILGIKSSIGVLSTNANIPISKGVPAICIGGGGAEGGAHSLNEWWLNKDGYKGIQQALLLLVAEAGLEK
jgi:tripeptide aminopeptidase